MPYIHIPQSIVIFPCLADQFRVAANLAKFLHLFLPRNAHARRALLLILLSHLISHRNRPLSVRTIFPRKFRHGPDILNLRIVLNNRTGIHDISAISGHTVNNLLTNLANLAGGPVA